jgi:hypothetical protein
MGLTGHTVKELRRASHLPEIKNRLKYKEVEQHR